MTTTATSWPRGHAGAQPVHVVVVSPREETLRDLRTRLPARYRLEASEQAWRTDPFARKRRPDLILIELRPPIADVFTALRGVRSAHPEVPILTVAEEPLRHVGELSLEAGASAFLAGPPSPWVLAERIRALADRRRPAGGEPSGVAW